jgi:hypothetical protein
MPLSVRLPPRVEQELEEYCVSHKVSKSEAVKRALEHLFEESGAKPSAWQLGKRFMGSDKRQGDVARHSKRLLRELVRNK